MQRVERSEILRLGDYEAIRPQFRARVIAEKKLRRVQLGPDMTAVFENKDTVLLQIQEMLRTERITREGAILHEIETYNELIPGENELSATVMIEIDDRTRREQFLVDARGIERAISLVVEDDGHGETRAPAKWDPARVDSERASAVLYLKFPLTAAAAKAVREGGAKITLVVEHAAYRARAEIGAEAKASLAEDLAAAS